MSTLQTRIHTTFLEHKPEIDGAKTESARKRIIKDVIAKIAKSLKTDKETVKSCLVRLGLL